MPIKLGLVKFLSTHFEQLFPDDPKIFHKPEVLPSAQLVSQYAEFHEEDSQREFSKAQKWSAQA